MLSLRSSVETLRKGTLEQQIKHLEKPSPTRIKPASRNNSSTMNTSTSDPLNTSGVGGGEAAAYSKVRTEFIPIEWYDAIRKDNEGDRLTEKLKRVSLPSVPLFRQFANDAVSK